MSRRIRIKRICEGDIRDPGGSASVVRSANEKPVAVLSHNKPAFYMLTPTLYEATLEEIENRQWENLVRKRLETKDNVVMVDLDAI